LKKITIGFSPCPNDTFIFDALVNGRIDTGEYHFEPFLADVEELNRMAMSGKLDITKISIGAYAAASEKYIILDSGSALGKGVGPIMVSITKMGIAEFQKMKVAIPGKFTTANLLLSAFFPQITNKQEMLFSEIENAVLKGEFDAGLLIHEGRFTFEKRGLLKLFDLGEVWEQKMNMPLPLGCIAAKRNIPAAESIEVSNLIRTSLEYGYKNPQESSQYIFEHAQEMEPDVIAGHIALYVNEFSLNLGTEGRNAISFLLQKGIEQGLLPQLTQPVFNTLQS
jgi:1,4-dihydroxy-6-naphthoate synthase